MKLSLEKIARKLRLSRRTLSRAIKNEGYVSSAVRKRILLCLKKNNYTPNFYASVLASKRTNVIGLLFPRGAFGGEPEFYIQEVLRGVERAVKEKGYQLMLFAQERYNNDECLKLYKSRLVAGLLITASAQDDYPELYKMKSNRIPLVLINASYRGFNSFDTDNIKGGYAATAYLIAHGRKRIAFIHGHKNWINADDRFKGYKRALAEAHIPFRKKYVQFGYFDCNKGRVATEKLLSLKIPPDAIFAANDKMAIGAIQAIKRSKKKIPSHIALVGYDNHPLCEHIDPPLTTVYQPIGEIAYQACLRLIELISFQKTSRLVVRKLFNPQLIIRDSTDNR
ncbi:MAG: LacI family DNA-binding transcriptional regulator [Candidatus Omnitrophota bacterium]